MDRFFVGQRVRIRWSQAWPDLAGKQGRIVAHVAHPPIPALRGIKAEWKVAPDVWAGSGSRHDMACFHAAGDQLEPLQPEGMEPVEWEDCAWKPDEVPELVYLPRYVR